MPVASTARFGAVVVVVVLMFPAYIERAGLTYANHTRDERIETMGSALETWASIATIAAVPVGVMLAVIGWFLLPNRKTNKSTGSIGGPAMAGDVHAGTAGIVTGHNSPVNLQVTVEANKREELSSQRKRTRIPTEGGDAVPRDWQGIFPDESKYEFVTEVRDSIPLGIQTFSFEYGPRGHAKPLSLKGRTSLRTEIQFSCRIVNEVKALFGANEFALNVLQPRFLVLAREILEKYSLAEIRSSRNDVSKEIVMKLSGEFDELGVHLEAVRIGALEKLAIPSRRQTAHTSKQSTPRT
jgi:hypothetical protein